MDYPLKDPRELWQEEETPRILDDFYATLRDDATGNRRELRVRAVSFAEAEKLARKHLTVGEQIIRIDYDY